MDVAAATAQVTGAALVFLALADVFLTVLFPASGRGPVREPLSRSIWRMFRWLARRAGRRRASVLAYSGPVQITATITAWWVLLILGWALIYLPAVGESITAATGDTQDTFWTAVYYSGFTQSTLGVGDVVAASAPYRVLTIVHASTGFAVMTMVLTYFLSVYSVLPGRNASAMRLHHLTRKTDDAAVLVGVLTTDHPTAMLSELGSAGEFLRHITQSHRSYPVLRYFHYRNSFYALPQLLFTVLEVIALIRSCVDEQEYPSVGRASVLESTSLAAQALLNELVDEPDETSPCPDTVACWRKRYAAAARTLRAQGVVVRPEDHKGEDEYVRLRSKWDAQLARLSDAMLHRWSSSTPTPPG